MKKIMFNDRYGLTQAVLEGRKTQTRRIAYTAGRMEGLTIRQDLEGVNKGRACLFEGGILLAKSAYKLGETIAIAQKYDNLVKDDEFYRLCGIHGMPLECIKYEKGCTNKMFVRADLSPITSASPASTSNVCKISATRTVWKKEFGHEPEDGIVMTS